MADAGQHTNDIALDAESESNKRDATTQTLTFEIKNTFWHKLCNEERATKIPSYTFSIPLTTVMVILVLIGVILNVSGVDESQRAFYLSYKLIVAMMVVVWATSILLYVNIEAAKLVIRLFAFWIKTLSITQALILHFILAYHFKFWNDGNDENVGLEATADVFLAIALFNAVLVYCFADGLYLRRKYKIAASGMFTVGAGLYTMSVVLNSPANDDTVINIGTVFSYSVYSGYNSAVQVLCLFLAQSAFYMLWSPKQCINISGGRPFVKWK